MPANVEESVAKYIDSRNISAIEERANAFYANLKVPETVEKVNRVISSNVAKIRYVK